MSDVKGVRDIEGLAREYLKIWVAYDIAVVQEGLEAENDSGTTVAQAVWLQERRLKRLEVEVRNRTAKTLAELRAKAAITLVSEFNRSDEIDLVADLACDILGVAGIDELGDDAATVAMEILRRELV